MNSPIYCPSCQLETKEWIESSCSSQKICPDSDLFFSAYFPGSSDVAPFPIPLTRDLHLSQFRAVRHSFTTCQRRALHRKRMGFRQVLVGHPRTAKLLYLVVCILLHNVILCSTFIHIFRTYIRLEFSNFQTELMQPSDREDQWDRFPGPGAHSWEWMQGYENSQSRRSS